VAISKRFAAEQIRRFASHPNFPDPIGQADLLKAFESVCDRDEQVRDIADYLNRTLIFAPLPANVYQAAEALAEQRRYDNGPRIFDEPGETGGWLTDAMTEEDYERWKKKAASAKIEHVRDIAQAIVERYDSQRGKR
jgi:hypothetical protein